MSSVLLDSSHGILFFFFCPGSFMAFELLLSDGNGVTWWKWSCLLAFFDCLTRAWKTHGEELVRLIVFRIEWQPDINNLFGSEKQIWRDTVVSFLSTFCGWSVEFKVLEIEDDTYQLWMFSRLAFVCMCVSGFIHNKWAYIKVVAK